MAAKKRAQKHRHDPSLDAFMKHIEATAGRAHAEFERLNALPYDGVHGEPPEWVPEPVRNQFFTARRRLLAEVDADALAEQLTAYCRKGHPTIIPGTVQDFRVYIADLSLLVDIFTASKREPSEGLPLLAGPDAALGYSRRQQLQQFGERRGTERKSAADERRNLHQQIAAEIVRRNPTLRGNGKRSALARAVRRSLHDQRIDGEGHSVDSIRRNLKDA